MFFENWFGLLRVVVVGPLAYAALIAILRISGKRTLAKMNAFDRFRRFRGFSVVPKTHAGGCGALRDVNGFAEHR